MYQPSRYLLYLLILFSSIDSRRTCFGGRWSPPRFSVDGGSMSTCLRRARSWTDGGVAARSLAGWRGGILPHCALLCCSGAETTSARPRTRQCYAGMLLFIPVSHKPPNADVTGGVILSGVHGVNGHKFWSGFLYGFYNLYLKHVDNNMKKLI